MATYSIKAIGQNLTYSWLFFENDKLTKEQAMKKLRKFKRINKNYQKQFNTYPTITNNRGHKINITKYELIENIGAF